MSRKLLTQSLKPKGKSQHRFKITQVGPRGEGIGSIKHLNKDFKVLVPAVILGEEVQCELSQAPNSMLLRATLTSVVVPSPQRVSAPCPYFESCGACHLMHMKYDYQLSLKGQEVTHNMKDLHLSGLVQACVPSPNPFHYRNKINLMATVSGQEKLVGYFHKQNSQQIISVDQCCVSVKPIHTLMKLWQPFLKDLPIFDPTSGRGYIRQITCRANQEGKIQLLFHCNSSESYDELEAISNRLLQARIGVDSVYRTTPATYQYVHIGGDTHLLEVINGLQFRLSPSSFFQINTNQAESIYSEALKDISKEDIVIDAFCGVGTLTCLAAKKAKKAIGIEAVADAVSDAHSNAKLNQLSNCEFRLGETQKILPQILEEVDPFYTAVILNPPRTGLVPSVIKSLTHSKPSKIIYISCDPATLARDLKLLLGLSNYKVQTIIPFDMFPQTTHVETIVKLIL